MGLQAASINTEAQAANLVAARIIVIVKTTPAISSYIFVCRRFSDDKGRFPA
jgi:hypothetical protein